MPGKKREVIKIPWSLERPADGELGLQWENLGNIPPAGGEEIFCEPLVEALRKAGNLSPSEWAKLRTQLLQETSSGQRGLGISELRESNFVKVDADYFRPSLEEEIEVTIIQMRPDMATAAK